MGNINVEVAKISSHTLNTRDEAIKLFNFLQMNYLNEAIIVLNFANVEFMSRSFADQFHQLKANWEIRKDNRIQLENGNSQINEILKAVSDSQYNQDNKRKIRSEIKEISFTEMKQFEEYLLGI